MKIIRLRFLVFITLFSVIIAGYFSRLFYMQIVRHDYYRQKLDKQVSRVIPLASTRGNIYDRNGNPLAIMEPAYSIFAVPVDTPDKWAFSRIVGPILGVAPIDLYHKINNKQTFVWLARKVSNAQYKALKVLPERNYTLFRGLGFAQEDRRIYPNQTLACQILGFVGMDNQGLNGLEYALDKALCGQPGKMLSDHDPYGRRLVTGVRKVIAPKYNGQQIYLTLDNYIQYVVQKNLAQTCQYFRAKAGQVIILKPDTGEILAMANYPVFDNNNYQKSARALWRNTCVTDVFEPGSVFKLVTMGAALEEGIIQEDSHLIIPETMQVQGKTIREAHGRPKEISDDRPVEDIIRESLNVGSAILGEKLGSKRLNHYIQGFGFGKSTGSGFPGESGGILRDVNTWGPLDRSTISFGQGVAATTMQMVTAVAIIANDGKKVKPHIIHHMTNDQNTTMKSVPVEEQGQIISPEAAKIVGRMMLSVVENGTGKIVQIPGYSIVGKTGTAQKPGPNGLGYIPGTYVASFIGYFPLEKPEFAMLVVIDTPTNGAIYGSEVAAPLFRKIAVELIDRYSIPPSKGVGLKEELPVNYLFSPQELVAKALQNPTPEIKKTERTSNQNLMLKEDPYEKGIRKPGQKIVPRQETVID